MIRRVVSLLTGLSLVVCISLILMPEIDSLRDGITFGRANGRVTTVDLAIRGMIRIDHASAWPHPAVFSRIRFSDESVQKGIYLDYRPGGAVWLQWKPVIWCWHRPASTHYLVEVLDYQRRTVILSSSPTPVAGWSVLFPSWLAALPFAVPPLWLIYRRARVLRRMRRGLCVVCGYDLRASKERCPECGTSIAAGTQAGSLCHDAGERTGE